MTAALHRSGTVLTQPRCCLQIYLRPFEIAVRESKPLSFMTSYNRLNGLHCSENKDLLDTVLRKEWGWEGMIMSDWSGSLTLPTHWRHSLTDDLNTHLGVQVGSLRKCLISTRAFPASLPSFP